MVGLTANSHWLWAEGEVTSVQEEELLPDWLMSVRWVDSGKVRLGELERVAGKALRQGRLVEEEEAFAKTNSSSCTLAAK